jgi:hypothetical protein
VSPTASSNDRLRTQRFLCNYLAFLVSLCTFSPNAHVKIGPNSLLKFSDAEDVVAMSEWAESAEGRERNRTLKDFFDEHAK